MRFQWVIVGVSSICFSLLTAHLHAESAFLEADGRVVIEVESAPVISSWTKGTSPSDFTGTGFYEWKAGNPATGTDSAGSGILRYPISISTTGRYRLQIRSQPAHSTEHNDVWVRVQGATKVEAVRSNGSDVRNLGNAWTKSYNNSANTWSWNTNTVDHDAHWLWVEAAAGSTIAVELSGRSTQFKVDRLVLYTDAHTTAASTATSLTESPTSGGGGGGGGGGNGDGQVTISGELKQWHRIDIAQQAISSSEMAATNPFLDYRYNVTCTAPSGKKLVIPGYFATDGAGGDAGNVWMAHINPSELGTWTYVVSFRSGANVAVSTDANAGTAVAPFNGKSGSFVVGASNKSGADFRATSKGVLTNAGNHYLTYGGSGNPFVFAGPGIPENILGYRGFTNTTAGIGHEFSAHLGDWHSGDPDWNSGAGKKLIGVLNYIAEQGGNCIYLMSNTIGGDGQDCFPHPTTSDSKDRYDLLKLQQWDLALAHAQRKGIYLHWVLAENETGNYTYYGGTASAGSLTTERKLYFRMMNARFGHYNGLKWNLCEEVEWNTAERAAQAAYIHAIDPYDHPVTYQAGGAGLPHSTFDEHMGNQNFDALSFQGGNSRGSMFDTMKSYRDKSATAGVKWAVAWDEPQKIENDNTDDVNGYPMGRRDKMWPCFMGGGDGFLWYIQADGGGHGFDQRIEDLTIMQNALRWSGAAREFLEPLPLLQMVPSRTVVASPNGSEDYTLLQAGEVYAIFNDRTGTGMTLDLTAVADTVAFTVQWFDPRAGGALQNGTVATVQGGGVRDIGAAPADLDKDWACVVRRNGAAPVNQAPTVSAGPDRNGTLPQTVAVDGTVSDDGLPTASVTVLWTKISGPGSVAFTQATAIDTTVTFGAAGTYILRLTATDGTLSAFDEVQVTVAASGPPVNQSPVVNAGPNRTVQVGNALALDATVTDDGLPTPVTLTTTWSVVSGPGVVTFGSTAAVDTTVSCTLSGSYVLKLTANDGSLSAFDTVTITVQNAPVTPPAATSSPPSNTKGSNCGLGHAFSALIFLFAFTLRRP